MGCARAYILEMSRIASLLYPQLRAFPAGERGAALRRARSAPFDVVELIGIAVGLVVAAALTRYEAAGMSEVERALAALANFGLAAGLLVVLVGPFLVRRARRALEREIDDRGRR